MGLQARLEEDLKRALRAGDALRVSTIRLARAAKNAEIEPRREAIDAFQRGGRDDLARKESLEMAVLLQYLPTSLGAVVSRLVREALGG